MVRTWYFHCRGMSSVPDWGTKIPQAAWCGKKKKKKILTLFTELWDHHL